jgi:purine-nucleoside phosphorylase
VLVAEQMFASGCRLLVSVTSAGRIASSLPDDACFLLIERALRDEGTSYHYVKADRRFAAADPALIALARDATAATELQVLCGATWTTDAPFRETAQAIAAAAAAGVQAVEMEAAALYAFAAARKVAVLCVAHVTNSMAQTEGDFEKGEADGSTDALAILACILRAWSAANGA